MIYVRIPVDNIAQSAAFYADLLDAPADVHGSGEYAEIERGDVLLALFGPGLLPKENGTPLLRDPISFSLPVHDLATAAAPAIRAGARALAGDAISDAHGNRIQFAEQP